MKRIHLSTAAIATLITIAVTSCGTSTKNQTDAQLASSNMRPLITCNNREFVLDVNANRPSELQAVIHGAHAVSSLLFPNQGTNEAKKNLTLDLYDGNQTLVIRNLKGFHRTSGFKHGHEGAGFYNAAAVSIIRSLADIEAVSDVDLTALPNYHNNAVRTNFGLDFYLPDNKATGASTGLGGSVPIRNERTLNVVLGQNQYYFYNCHR